MITVAAQTLSQHLHSRKGQRRSPCRPRLGITSRSRPPIAQPSRANTPPTSRHGL